ncbi:helix-turn-helix domain-containing protein [Enterococcus sp. AZ007]|uniref:helix-turn-helix domain-containing protein n=1 Tax=Enterococcus sp. AZ007 TaxID=2774839 RepID=UPI003F239616
MNKFDEHKLIVDRILELVHDNNITINKLASLSHIRQSTLNGIINEDRIPNLSTISKICNGLNISLKDFFDYEGFNKK